MNSLSVVSSILLLLALNTANAALAYDGSWHKEASWSGEYPNGFTMDADVTEMKACCFAAEPGER
jgi:hypothetical protein